MLEKIYNYARLAITIATTTIAIIKFVQAKKSSGENERLRKTITLAQIVQQIPSLIQKAEALFPSTGEIKFGPQKLEYVLKEIQILCMQSDIKYLEDEFTYEIERLLEIPQKKESVNEI